MAVSRSGSEIHIQQVDNQYYKVKRANRQKKSRKTKKTMTMTADDITVLIRRGLQTINKDRDEWKRLEETFTRGRVCIQ